ncbi:DNA excision repair protein ERCC-5 homolog isoform X1 [Nothobranchius furzeri]|uniref:Excision repair cross-complementation group 5 n=4 Tax=Nothobranchius TaxID=28779 RepID=A0A8C6LBP2_NOTFU|nr:excision repair cross-complementation group 5 [Nothobranchius furzeri]
MGVHGLWRLLESTGKPINPETLEGKILAVDISIWLNQAVKGVRDREGNSVQNAHLLTLFNRVCKLLFFRIRPVFVFDGDAPLLKKQTLALRRQRKEELTRESKQTNEKLLKTFLKRQALKAALGDKSKDQLSSLSSVRRVEVDDMYVLPALPLVEEKDKSSSEEEDEESRGNEDKVDSTHTYEEELYEDPNSVDINSEEFTHLPPEMKHEILKEMKEFCKRRRTMFHKPPECSGDFSQYQLAGLLQRNRLNQRLEGVEKEMSQRSAGGAPQLCPEDGDEQRRSIEANRLVSEDNSHYILIKGSKQKEATSDGGPASALWSGKSLSANRRTADRPEPLWRPVGEEEMEAHASSSKPSVSDPSQGDTAPPSPRTLKAIQAAMNDSSDEEKKQGSVSPRTLLAIQQALTEEGDGASSSPTKLQMCLHPPVPQVVISSSDEESQPSSKETSEFERSITRQSSDSLLDSSSEEEMEEVIGQRNKALRLAAFERSPKKEAESEEELLKAPENVEKSESERKPDQKSQNTLVICLPSEPIEKSTRTSTNIHPAVTEERNERPSEAADGTNGDEAKPEDSESEESFIEVPQEESKEGCAEDPAVVERRPSGELREDVTGSEGGLPEVPDHPAPGSEGEEESEDRRDTQSKPAASEWEHIDADELEALENSLEMEQRNLREQKQQQERMANTVTGQMYLESQELLRLFGVPFLVAPMEAEAQCAALDRADQTHGTITDDSDVWLFGGRHVYKNFFSQSKYVEHYQYSDLQSQLGLDRTKLINLAYLLGSDYTEGVPGVGHVTGMEILNEFPGPGLDPLVQLSKWWSEAQENSRLVADHRDTKVKRKLRDLKLQMGFPNPAVAQAYLEPAVDRSDGSFSWGRPQLDLIKEFCLSRFGWSSRKTEETLQPVIKQLNSQQSQMRIDSFFRLEQQEKQAIRSQRLRRAVTCLKRKEREGGGGEDSEEEEIKSPSKRGGAKNSEGQKEEERSVTGAGGFLSSEVADELPLTPLKDVCRSGESSVVAKRARKVSRSSSSDEDSDDDDDDDDDGKKVTMVTARSVFEGNKRGRGAKRSRGRGKVRGKKL